MSGKNTVALLPQRAYTEGISTSVLQEYLHNLEGRKGQVLAAFLEGLSIAANAGPGGLQYDAVASLAERPSDVGEQLAALAVEHGQLSARLAEAETAERKLDALVKLQQRLADFDLLMSTGEYGEAAMSAVELQRSSEEDSANTALREQTEQRTSSLLQALTEKVTSLIQVSQDSISVLDPAAAPRVWMGLTILHQRTPHVKALAQQVTGTIIVPLIHAGGKTCMQTAQHSSGGGHTLTRHDDDDAAEGGLEASLLTTLRFLAEVACGGHADTITELGHLVWPKLAAAYIERRLAPAAPRDEAGLDAFQGMAKAAERFEGDAAATGLVPVSDEGKGRIQQYVANALDKALRGRRLRIVGAARDMLMAPDQETDVVGRPLPVNTEAVAALKERLTQGHTGQSADIPLNWGAEGQEGPVLATGRFRITCSADKIVQLMHQAARDATSSRSPALAQTLIAAVTDVADLAASLPPQTRAKEMQLPHPAALYHNDCQHIGDQMLSLPYTYSPKLAQLAPSAPAQLIDAAQRLKEAGNAVLNAQAARQAEEVAQVLAQAQGWRGLHQAQRGIAARRVVQQAQHALRRLGDALGGTLAPRDFVRAAAAAVDALAERAGDDILAMRDISVEESEELPKILGPIADDAPMVALGGASALDQAPVDRELLITAIEAASHNLARLKDILFILGANLAQIEERWDSGRLRASGLSSQHVGSLIQALFEDTERKEEALYHIRST